MDIVLELTDQPLEACSAEVDRFARSAKIDESFVQRQWLNQRRESAQHLHYLTACRVVRAESANQERRMRAASPCLMHRHCGPYAEDAGFVRRGGDDTTLAETAYHDRLTA
jgi:hypothetical protein